MVNKSIVPKKPDNLTDKQWRFIMAYVTNGLNATQAALAAGYSKESAYQIASENLRKVEIRTQIDELLSGFVMSKAEILEQLQEIAKGPDTSDSDRMRAMELIGKAYAMWTDRQQQDTRLEIIVKREE